MKIPYLKQISTACIIYMLLVSPKFLFAFDSVVDPKVEQALLDNDWVKVYSLLNEVKAATDSSLNKLVKGHAALALNKNNESLELFLTSYSTKLLSEWESWTQAFLKSSKKPISFYLAGDSKARLELWDESIEFFSKALPLVPNNSNLKALILNARGVVFLAKKDWLRSKGDFESAIKLNPKLADVFSNLGFRYIAKKDGIPGTLDAFNHALVLNPDFALVIHGKACVSSLINNTSTNITKEFDRAITLAPFASLIFGSNILKIQAKLMSISEKELLSLYSGDSSGTTLNIRFSEVEANKAFNDLKTNMSQSSVSNFVNVYKNSTELIKQNLDGRIKNEIGSLDNEKFQNYLNNVDRTTHVANFFIPAIKSVIEVGGDILTGAGAIWIGGSVASAGTLSLPGVGLAAGGQAIKEYGSQGMDRLSSLNAQRLETSKMLRSVNEDYMYRTNQFSKQLSTTHTPSVFKSEQKIPDLSKQQNVTFREINSPGGVQIDFSNALWQDGEWPFDAYFGLVYNVNSQLSVKK